MCELIHECAHDTPHRKPYHTNDLKGLDILSKSKLRELLLNGHITQEEYMAEFYRLNELRERVYKLYLNGQITLAEMKDLLAELDQKDGLQEPPTIY